MKECGDVFNHSVAEVVEIASFGGMHLQMVVEIYRMSVSRDFDARIDAALH